MLIGEVSQHSGVSARMLRHYDSIGLLSPTGRTAAGYREYSEPDLQRLFHVEILRSLGLSLLEAQRALDESSFTPSMLIEELVTRTRESIAREQDLLRRLQQVHASGPARWDEVLRIVSLVRGLHSDDPSRRQTSALSTVDGEPDGLTGTLAQAVLAEADPNAAGALRWALKRSGDEALGVLAPALDSADAAVRLRAVTAIAELSSRHVTAVLAGALEHPDEAVRHQAALALGIREERSALPILTDMVVNGGRDVEASELLGLLARRLDLADSIVGSIAEEIGVADREPRARIRLTQALAELPVAAARATLHALESDVDLHVAGTARYILQRVEADY